jgi:hypothetical protein
LVVKFPHTPWESNMAIENPCGLAMEVSLAKSSN